MVRVCLAHRLRGESVPQPRLHTRGGLAGVRGRAVQGSACGPAAGVRLTLGCHSSCPALPSRPRGVFAGQAPGCSNTRGPEDFAGYSAQSPTSVPLRVVEHPSYAARLDDRAPRA
jgi:hypothetical protein